MLRTKLSEDGTSITRQRGCSNTTHRFDTIERNAKATLEKVLVRRTGDRKLASGTFDQARLLADVRRGVLKRLNETETAEVVRAAVYDLEANLAEHLQALTNEEQEERPGHAGVIDDSTITEAVETQLVKSTSRMAHVLYALYIRGRSDRENRPGWGGARDVLGWLHQNYPNLAAPLPNSPYVVEDKWFPASQAPSPNFVIKRPPEPPSLRNRRTDTPSRPDRVPFSKPQFEKSIVRALSGRPESELQAYCVVQWVLWGLAGQSDVHSSQLAVGVLDCLRRLDDVAYLRWASIAKNIDSVTTFNTEALGLIRHPSPRLYFDVSAGRALPERAPDAGSGPPPIDER